MNKKRTHEGFKKEMLKNPKVREAYEKLCGVCLKKKYSLVCFLSHLLITIKKLKISK